MFEREGEKWREEEGGRDGAGIKQKYDEDDKGEKKQQEIKHNSAELFHSMLLMLRLRAPIKKCRITKNFIQEGAYLVSHHSP